MLEGLWSHGGDCGFSSIRWGKPLGLSQEETDRGKAALWEGCWDHRLWHRFQAGGGRKGSQETAWGQRPSVVRGEWRGRDPEKGTQVNKRRAELRCPNQTDDRVVFRLTPVVSAKAPPCPAGGPGVYTVQLENH